MNQLTTPSTAIYPSEYPRLRIEADRVISVQDKTVGKHMPVKDDLGNTYRWEYQLVPYGTEIFFREEPSQELLKFITMPATDIQIGKMFSDLSAHKPYGRGEEYFSIVVRDLAKDLAGFSGWAIKKVCEKFRLDKSTTFFPDTALIVSEVRALHDQIRWHGLSIPKPKKEPEFVGREIPNKEGMQKVADILHSAGMKHSPEHCEACKKEEVVNG